MNENDNLQRYSRSQTHIKLLLCIRCRAYSFSSITSLKPYVIPDYRSGDLDPERRNNLPKVTRLIMTEPDLNPDSNPPRQCLPHT